METIQFKKNVIQAYVLEEEEISEDNLNFLKENINNTLFLHEIDSKKLQVLVSKYENSKKIILPAYLFDFNFSEKEDLPDENQYSEKEEKSIFPNIVIPHKKDFIKVCIGLLIGVIIVKGLSLSNADMLTSNVLQSKQETTKSDILILTDKLNKNNIAKADKQKLRKEYSDLLKNIDSEISNINNENSLIISNIDLLTK